MYKSEKFKTCGVLKILSDENGTLERIMRFNSLDILFWKNCPQFKKNTIYKGFF